MLDRLPPMPAQMRFRPELSTRSVLSLPVREAVAAAEGRTGWIARLGAYRPAEPPSRSGTGPAGRDRRTPRADRRAEGSDRAHHGGDRAAQGTDDH